MRWVVPLLIGLLLAPLCFGQSDGSAAQVIAARSDALENLRQEILAARIQPDITVQMLVDRASGEGVLNKALVSAKQVGGPRWIDDQTAQVRVEINGGPIADALIQMAQGKPNAISIPPNTVRDRLKRWKNRTFSAVGNSTSSSAVDRLRPDPSQLSWRSVSEQDRRRAVDTARQNAVQRVVDSLKTITWDGSRRLADALAVNEVDQKLRGWLGKRPVTSVEFRDNLEIRLTLAASPPEVWPVLREAMESQKSVPPPAGPADWEQLRSEVENKMAAPCGTAAAVPAVAVTRPKVSISHEPPDWVNQSIDTQATASAPGSLLRAAKAAKADAQQQLRAKINAMPLSPKMTLGQAAKLDPRVEDALARGVSRAQVSKVEYDTPHRGQATATLSLDLAEVWRELSALAE